MLGWLGGWTDEWLGGDMAGCVAGGVVGGKVGQRDMLLASCQAGWGVRRMNGWVAMWLVISLDF